MASMNALDVLRDAASRPIDSVAQVLDGLSPDALRALPGGSQNSIAWLVWHAARQADVQLAALTGDDEVWAAGWAGRLGVERGVGDFGFGDTPEDVAALRVRDADALRAYLVATMDAVSAYVASLTEPDLDAVVDDSYEPPVTRGVRLVSIIEDAAVHLGQAAYARGLLEGWSIGY